MNKKLKKQHYVPQFYLKNFSMRKTRKNKKAYNIFCFDKEEEKIFPSNIKNIAQQKYFHDIDTESLESYVSERESEHSKIIHEIVRFEDYKFLNNYEIRLETSYFLSMQMVRTQLIREIFKRKMKGYETIIKENSEKISPELKEKITEYNNEKMQRALHLKMIIESENDFSHYFMNKKWILLQNFTDMPFWTSDNPITKYNPLPNGDYGIASPNIKIFLPLSPKLCLCLLDPKNYSSFNKKQKINPYKVRENITKVDKNIIKDEKDIQFINILQGKQSYKQIFSKNKEDLSVIASLIDKKIILKEDENKRFEMGILKENRNLIHFKLNQ